MHDHRHSFPPHLSRQRPIGAEPLPGGVSFRVWAPARNSVTVVIEGGGEQALSPEPGGYFSGMVEDARPGSRYRFRLDGSRLCPDPASRRQPDGPHGPSEVVDPAAYAWRDGDWPGPALEGQVVYEMHIGTFTPEGSWAAAARELRRLREVGITLIEMMPVNEFPGRFGWGYDGVDLFAPTRLYGAPDDLRAFIDAAHGLGMGVILDVVYNHLGPDGNYLAAFSPDYFTDRYPCEWGEAINFDGPNAAGVREFFTTNAACWIDEFHFDGLRIDATQSIFDASDQHILTEIVRAARAAAGKRRILVIGENEPQHVRMLQGQDEGGHGLDAVWNDDFHHSAMVAMTGRRPAYYSDHAGGPQEFVSAAKYGWLFQGQHYSWQGKRRGTPSLAIPPARFVNFVQNHDQVANSGRGLRFHQRTSAGRARAMTALLLLLPGTPMLFQGQEYWARTPFLYFADHVPELARSVAKGRKEFLAQFPSLASEEAFERLPDPDAEATFRSCVLDRTERERHGQAIALHRDLLRLRRDDPVFSAQRQGGLDGAVLGPEAFLLRYFAGDGLDRLLLVNLGLDLDLPSVPEPLIAPPAGCDWRLIWSSEHPEYGGGGTPAIERGQRWHLPGHAALVMTAEPESNADEAGPG